MAVGLDETATDCIDPALGEVELPPLPPAGVFDIRFDVATYGCGPLTGAILITDIPCDFRFTGQFSTICNSEKCCRNTCRSYL